MIIKIPRRYLLKEGPEFPKRVTSKCPAIILAVSRTANVPGRIIFLVVSMITRNGSKIFGAPWGTRWANIWVVFFIQPNNIKVIHNGNLKDRVIFKWLVHVKI